LIRGYFGVNMVTLWKAAKQDAPQVKGLIVAVRADIEDDSEERE